MKIKIQLIGDAKMPNYAHKGDAGLDIYSAEEDYVLKAGERRGFKTGVKMEIPKGYAALFWDKSGLAINHGIITMGGVIDSTYRGEFAVILKNLGDKDYKVEKHAKISQVLIQKIEEAEFEEVNFLEKTERDEHGFGSTGLN
ncbi:dUTP diphosphatase [Patescibacteria group bacterium]|nr:dUTP diphosphatase [Patescibacteria group bacterium]